MSEEVMLYAPEGFWNLKEEQKREICNQCGPKGPFSDIIPNTVWGLSIGKACDIHDYMYYSAEPKIEAKEEADRVFLNNMIRLIKEDTKPWFYIFGIKIRNPLYSMRINRAYIYYEAVKRFGGSSFWKEKNKPETFKEI